MAKAQARSEAVQLRTLAGMGIIELPEAEDQLSDEVQLVSTVTRTQENGRLLLIIHGDDISKRVESISSYRHDTPLTVVGSPRGLLHQ